MMTMQAAPVPPPVAARSDGLPVSLCDGVPQVVQDGVRYCILGLRVTGSAAALAAAKADLAGLGWDAALMQPAAGPPVLTVDAAGMDLPALHRAEARLRSTGSGALAVATLAIPMPR